MDREENMSYNKFLEKIQTYLDERKDPTKRAERFERFEDRTDNSELTREDFMKQAKGKHLMQWKGLVLLKSVLDSSIYQLLLQELKPATVIEIGTFNGGSALWMADLMKIHGISSHIYTVDIDSTFLDPSISERDDITFIKGDSYNIGQSLSPQLLKSLPHPWLITEDAHVNLPQLLAYFDTFTQPGDYVIVEDTHPGIHMRGYGLYENVDYTPVGAQHTLNQFKEFMKTYGHKYRVDTGYTDLYGYNATWNLNSILCKVIDEDIRS